MKAGRKQAEPGSHGKRQTETRHPAEWQSDLNPDRLAGQNIGAEPSHRGLAMRTARDVKAIHRALRDLSDDELEQVPVLPDGARLEQGATYIDINRPRVVEFTAMGGITAGPPALYVPKDLVPYQIWNRLIAALTERAEDAPHRTPPAT